jgi:hypothetical protein
MMAHESASLLHMRMIVAALVLPLTGVAEAQLRSPSLSDTNEKARKAFAKQNE